MYAMRSTGCRLVVCCGPSPKAWVRCEPANRCEGMVRLERRVSPKPTSCTYTRLETANVLRLLVYAYTGRDRFGHFHGRLGGEPWLVLLTLAQAPAGRRNDGSGECWYFGVKVASPSPHHGSPWIRNWGLGFRGMASTSYK